VKLLYKYYLMIAIPLFICLVVIGIGLSFQMYDYSVSEKHKTLEHAATKVSTLPALYFDSVQSGEHNRSLFYDHRTLRTILNFISDNEQLHIIICDTDGEILIASGNNNKDYEQKQINSKILDETKTKARYSSTGSLGGLYSGENYTVGLPAANAFDEPIAYVFVTTSIENVHALLNEVRNIFMVLSIIVFTLTAILCYFIVRKMTKPLKQIAIASRDFAHGNFSTRVHSHSSDEIGELTVAFNNMADSLEKSEELKRSFIGNVSHELRSPMTSINGFVDGILDGTIPPERSEHYLRIVSDEVRRLSRLVSRMLDITVLQGTDITEQSTTFDFCELLKRVALSFEQRVTEAKITINVDIPAYSVNVFANEDAIYQVVYILIDNAVKFSQESSSIAITLTDKGGKLTFSIKNRGETIPEDQLKFIFDRFHKIDKSRSKDKKGLGLGLYIAKTIINQHHGKIMVTSKDNLTEFTFTIPSHGIR